MPTKLQKTPITLLLQASWTSITNRPQLKTFEEFEEDLNNGYYGDGEGQVKMCLPLQSVMRTLEKFPKHREELFEMFNYKMANLINPQLWEE